MKAFIAAGGTGGHIFPALAVALELRKRRDDVSLLWLGTTRNREVELCKKHDIPLVTLNVAGFARGSALKGIRSAAAFLRSLRETGRIFKKEKPDWVIAFGGYVCAPVLTLARMKKIPYFTHEQNTIPGVVNKLFAGGAACNFLGFPLVEKDMVKGERLVTGTPVRPIGGTYEDFAYPTGFDRNQQTILITGGSQGAASMNSLLVDHVPELLDRGVQIVWQTGKASYTEIASKLSTYDRAFVFESIDDLYPYYACVKLVVGRAGASTLNEVAFFGRPCIMIPLPWAAENHQWMNAGFAEGKGWGVRVAQDQECGKRVVEEVKSLLGDNDRYETMSMKALDSSPINASGVIVETMLEKVSEQ